MIFKEHDQQNIQLFETSVNRCISQIRKISEDNLQQLKKITLLNNQPVTKKLHNHFTETDGSEMTMISKQKDNNIFQVTQPVEDPNIKKDNQYYMSEETSKSKSKSKSNSIQQEQIQIPIYNTEYEKPNKIPIYEQKKLKDKSSISEPEKDQTSVYKNEDIKNNIILDDDEDDNMRISMVSYKEDPKNNDEIEVDVYNVISGTNDYINDLSKSMEHIYVEDTPPTPPTTPTVTKHETPEITITNETNEFQIRQDEPQYQLKTEQDLPIIPNEQNLIMKNEIEEQIKKFQQQKQDLIITKDTNTDIGNDSFESVVTIGGTRRRHRIKIQTQTDNEQEPTPTNKLLHMSAYTFNELKDICRTYSLPITYKDKTRTKLYKKEDLYRHIENHYKQNNI